MSYNHSNVYIVRVVDTDDQGADQTWYAGPYGATQAEQTAIQLQSAVREAVDLSGRQCHVEALFSDEECLRVTNDGRTEGSLY